MAYDVLIRGGLVYDGLGSEPQSADVAVVGDEIVRVGHAEPDAEAHEVIEAAGLAVAPGFVNMLSHSYGSLLVDPRGMSELVQGVTTQVFGEGYSMGPLTEAMRDRMVETQGSRKFDVPWMRLSEYLSHAESKGVSQNVCSYIGATTLRVHAIGHADRPATAEEMDLMRALVREEMADGALGIGSALIYPPGFFASTEELVELCAAAAPYGGRYISHLRSEGDAFCEAVDELLRISREAEVPAEIYHLKAAGGMNWPKMAQVVETLEAARSAGQSVSADVYTYTAGATALRSAIPPWFHDGGTPKMLERLKEPATRKEMADAIDHSTEGWENLYLASGGAEGVLVLGVGNDELRHLQGKTMAQIAAEWGIEPVDALLTLVERAPLAGAAYFIISEDNLREQLRIPWVAFGSDAAAQAAEPPFLDSPTHPRSYGNFARLLGHYCRDEGVVALADAIRRLTSLPCDRLGFSGRGRLTAGSYADLVVFDPATVGDRATYENAHQYAVGVRDVVVNGRLTLRDGEFTGTLAGRALR